MSDEGYIRIVNFTDCFDISVISTDAGGKITERDLGIYFNSRDKESLFFSALGVFNVAASVDGKIAVDDFHRGKLDELFGRFNLEVERATVNMPMIRRLHKEYENAEYSPAEVDALRRECQNVKAKTSDAGALSALDKLIRACDEAAKGRSGLFFASD